MADPDKIQEQCIRRMRRLGLNPNLVAAKAAEVSRTHVCDYLSRRKSMGSHKLQYVLRALGLGITETKEAKNEKRSG